MTDGKYSKLRIFISWSGDRSKDAAKAFRDWLPIVLQNVKPYFTPDDIDKGTRWAGEIRSELEISSFGVIFLTRDNLKSPWILFEAGALSKLDNSKVAPILLDVTPAEVAGPLGQLQLTPFNKEEFRKLIISINRELGELGLNESTLSTVFDHWWPNLDQAIQAAIQATPNHSIKVLRTEREMLEEVLERVRRISVREENTPRATKLGFDLAKALAGYIPPDETPLADLMFSIRHTRCLEAAGILTLGQLRRMGISDLTMVPNLGKEGVYDILSVLNGMGIVLAE
jgi:lambda repressor-like predicted transcriptional regulator